MERNPHQKFRIYDGPIYRCRQSGALFRSLMAISALFICLGKPTFAGPALCADLNPFIKEFLSQGVTIYPVPRNLPSDVCSKEWIHAGSCCDQSSIISYQQNQEKIFQQTLNRLQTEFENVAPKLQQALHNFVKLRTITASLDPNHLIVGDLDQFTHFIRHGLPYLATASHKEDLNCIHLTVGMRRTTTCSACAGNSHRYFEAGKARISIDACKAVISSCSATWNKLLILVQGLATTERIFNTIKNHFPAEFSSKSINFAQDMKAWIEASNVAPKLQNCMDPSLQTCVFDLAQAVCESLANLHNKTFIERAVQVIGDELAEFHVLDETISLLLSHLEQKHPELLSQWAIGAHTATSRQLSDIQALRGNFGDIQVVHSSAKDCYNCVMFDLGP